MPGLWLSQYSLRNAGSVPSFCVTSYWMDVSFFLSSASDGLVNCDIDPPLTLGLFAAVAATAVDCPCMQPKRKKRMRGKSLPLDWVTACLLTIGKRPVRRPLFDAGGARWFQNGRKLPAPAVAIQPIAVPSFAIVAHAVVLASGVPAAVAI